jgi:hypothetical protein
MARRNPAAKDKYKGRFHMSARLRGKGTLRASVAGLSLLLPIAVLAASPNTPPTGPKNDDELSQVNVTADKATRKPSDLIAWIRRLLGQYTIDGKVDLGGKGNPNERWTAVGTGTCIGFGVAPGVQCEMNVKWPAIPGPHGPEVLSGVSDLTPAMTLYAMEPDDIGIRYLQVNNKGLAEGATGFIINDTAEFKTPCVNAPPGCERVTRITVASDSKVINMDIDTMLNYELAARFNFKLRRVAEPQAEMKKPVPAGSAPAAQVGKTPPAPTGRPPAADKK